MAHMAAVVRVSRHLTVGFLCWFIAGSMWLLFPNVHSSIRIQCTRTAQFELNKIVQIERVQSGKQYQARCLGHNCTLVHK